MNKSCTDFQQIVHFKMETSFLWIVDPFTKDITVIMPTRSK